MNLSASCSAGEKKPQTGEFGLADVLEQFLYRYSTINGIPVSSKILIGNLKIQFGEYE